MKNLFIFWGCSFLIMLSSCSFDDDGMYIPQTQITFLLAIDSVDSEKQILSVKDNLLSDHQEKNWGISPGELRDFSGDETQFWISTVSPNSLSKIDPVEDKVIDEITDLPLTPDFICLGRHHLLISDSSNQTIGFFNLKSQSIDTIGGIKQPQQALYRGGKFYLAAGDGTLYIIFDQTASILSKIDLEYPITDLQANARTSVFIYSYSEDKYYETEIGYHSDQILTETKEVSYIKSRLSPYLDRPLGRELVSDIRLASRILFLADKPQCDDFEVDFLESVAYYQYQDSIYQLNALESQILPLGRFDGTFQKGYFIQ